MRWPEACRLIDRIKAERPELTVDHHASSVGGHVYLRVYCQKKGPAPGDPIGNCHLIPGSLATIYGPDGWKAYLENHPAPWSRPEDSYHTDALGREIDHKGRLVKETTPPEAPAITAQDMLDRIVALGRSDPGWWKDEAKITDLAAAWGVRTKGNGVRADYELEEVTRLSGDCHASILLARTGSGLWACGVTARWGDGGMTLEPSVGSVPYDSAHEARRAAFKDLIATLQAGRGATRHQQRQLLLSAVKERDRDRGLF